MDSTGRKGVGAGRRRPIVLAGRGLGSLLWASLILASCSDSGDEAPGAASGAPRLAVALSGACPDDAAWLRGLAGELEIEVQQRDALGRGEAQLEQIAILLDASPDALLLVPAGKRELDRSVALVADHGIPLLVVGEGAPSEGRRVGVGRVRGAREQAEDLGRRLDDVGVLSPRVVAVHDSRWPGAAARNEALLSALESGRELRLLRSVAIHLDAEGRLVESELATVFGGEEAEAVDVVLCADESSTRAVARAWSASSRAWLVGHSGDPSLATEAETQPRWRIAHYDREQLWRLALVRALGDRPEPAVPLLNLPSGKALALEEKP